MFRFPNIKIQTASHVFTANVFVCMICMCLSAIPYYHYFGKNTTILSMVFSSILMGVFYMLAGFFLHQKKLYISIACLVVWLLNGFAFVGFLSALVINISPIQFVTLCFSQSISIVIYTHISPRVMINDIAIGSMFAATIIVWLISIYGFVVEDDWMAAIVILLLSFFVILYNQRFLIHINTGEGGHYSTTWQSTASAIIYYYCMIGIHLVDKIDKFTKGQKILESERDFREDDLGEQKIEFQNDL